MESGNALRPDVHLLVKIGAIVCYAEDLLKGEDVREKLDRRLQDPDIKNWIDSLKQLELLPEN